jgi:ribonuclease P protein component
LNRKFRLTRSVDFQRVRRLGKSYAHPLLILVLFPHSEATPRIGVTAGRSVGGAVQRNRAKRLLRAAMSERLTEMAQGWDVILIARKPLASCSLKQTQAALDTLLGRAKIRTEVDGR